MEGLIRKIVIGPDVKNGMAYQVGMKLKNGSVVNAIVFDEEHMYKHGFKRYLIYVKDEDGISLWKAIDNMSCSVEFDLNF
jgi:hypothetical protein